MTKPQLLQAEGVITDELVQLPVKLHKAGVRSKVDCKVIGAKAMTIHNSYIWDDLNQVSLL